MGQAKRRPDVGTSPIRSSGTGRRGAAPDSPGKRLQPECKPGRERPLAENRVAKSWSKALGVGRQQVECLQEHLRSRHALAQLAGGPAKTRVVLWRMPPFAI